MEERALTVKQVAEYLNVTEKTIYNLLQKGELPGFKVSGAWRFWRKDIEAWTETNKRKIIKDRRKNISDSEEVKDIQ